MKKNDLSRFKFNLQTFAGEGEGDPPPEEFVMKKDPVSGQEVKVPKNLDAYLGHIISFERKAAKESADKTYQPILETLEKFKTENGEISAELQKLREANMTADERAQEQFKRTMKDLEGKVSASQEEAGKWKAKFTNTKILNDVFSSFGDIKLFNPQQVAKLFIDEGKAQIKPILDSEGKVTEEFETVLTVFISDDKGQLTEKTGTPSEVFKSWITQERNLHHVASTLQPGGGSKQGTSRRLTSDDLSKLSPEERLKQAHRQSI